MKQSNNKRKFSVYLSQSDIEQLDYVAKELDITRGELVRMELERAVLRLRNVYGNAKNSKSPLYYIYIIYAVYTRLA